MTRHTILFIDDYANCYITAEFNGDKTEFQKFGSSDSCDKDWAEIEAVFRGVNTLEQFKAANEKAQGFYHSSLPGKQILPIIPVHYIPIVEGIRQISSYIFVKE
ncbi:hypothetical protein AGMMS50268_16910 [Spirochaetia bacterium]|nr:hypothetical protein AGMMS50268_16910 [Spirochaetia bacterium]